MDFVELGRKLIGAGEPIIMVCILAGSSPETIQGPMGLKVSLFLARHSVRSLACQFRSLTSLPIVQPNTQSNASSRETPRGTATEDRNQLALVLKFLPRVTWFDDIFIVRDQCVVGAVANVRPNRKHWFCSTCRRHLYDVISIVNSDAVESAGDRRHEQLYVVERERCTWLCGARRRACLRPQ